MQIVKVESTFKLVAIKMPITITLLHLLAYVLFVFTPCIFSINCYVSSALEHVYL